MSALKWFAITVTIVVGEVLIFSAYVMHATTAISQMVAQIVASFVLF